jgi:hypothetical protein
MLMYSICLNVEQNEPGIILEKKDFKCAIIDVLECSLKNCRCYGQQKNRCTRGANSKINSSKLCYSYSARYLGNRKR